MQKTTSFWLFFCVQHIVAGQVVKDSLPALRGIDLMEVALLRTTRTYQQLERVMAVTGPDCLFLDLLPGVLPLDLPINAFAVTSPFGVRYHPIHLQRHFHGGIDVKGRSGLPVKATAPGFVTQVGYQSSIGLFVQVQHAYGFETVYGHLASHCVKVGQRVSINDEIGRVGQTGLTTGPHLHYVIKKNGSNVDPYAFCFLLRRRHFLLHQSSKPVPASSGNPTFQDSSSVGVRD